MDVSVKWVDRSLVVCDLQGEATLKELESMIDELGARPETSSELMLLADAQKLDVSKLTASDIKELAETGSRLMDGWEISAAFVVGTGSPSRYGLARMLQSYLISLSVKGSFEIFETPRQAKTWINRQHLAAAAASYC